MSGRGHAAGGILGLCIAILIMPCRARGAPLDYGLAPPPLDLAQVSLPAVPEESPEQLDPQSVRFLRDEAVRAFRARAYAASLDHLDQMAALVELPPNLLVLQAWATTYTGLDQRAADLWTALAQVAPADARRQEMAGWHTLRKGDADQALAHYQQAARLEPAAARLQHMQGLCLWQMGRMASAERFLVKAMQARDPAPESLLAMAALQAQQEHLPEALGWLRRVLPALAVEERARWLNQPDFNILAVRLPAEWETVLQEMGVAGLGLAYTALGTDSAGQPPPALGEAPLPPPERYLRLSPFSSDPAVQREQVRLHQMEVALRRLRAHEQLPEEEESMLENYETMGQGQ